MNPDQEPRLQHPTEPLNQPPTPPEASGPSVASELPKVLAEAEETHDYNHPILDQPKKTYHPKRLITILAVIVGVSLLAVGGMLAASLLPAKQSTKPPSDTKTTTTETPVAKTAKQVIDGVATYFSGTKKALTAIDVPVTAPGESFYTVIPDIKPLTSIAGEVAPDSSDQQLASVLKSVESNEFTKQVVHDGTKGTDYLANFTRSDVICQVAVTKPGDAKLNHWFEIRCLDMSQYSEYAKAQKPFVTLYTPTSTGSALVGFTGKPAPKASKTKGYQTLELPASTVIDQKLTTPGNLAMFYQTTDGLWHYFQDRSSSLLVECEKYNSNNLRYAYADQQCRRASTGKTEAVVAPKTKSN